MGGWNILDDEPSYLAKESVMAGMNDMIDFAEKRQWKKRVLFDTSDSNANLRIETKGFVGDAKDLTANGWIIELVTNLFTHKVRLYLFHPELQLIGRGMYTDQTDKDGCINLEFLMHCKSFKKKYRGSGESPIRTFIGEPAPRIENYTVEELLNIITARLRAEIPKVKEVKLPPKSNVVDITGLLNEYKEKEIQALAKQAV